MKPEEIREVFMRSAKDLLDYDEEGRGPANVAVRVESYELVGKNSILLSLEENIDDTLGAYLYVGDFLVLDKDVVSYSFYDRNTKTLGATIDNPGIIGMIAAEHPEMTVEFDDGRRAKDLKSGEYVLLPRTMKDKYFKPERTAK